MRRSEEMVIFSGEDECVSVNCPCGSRWDAGINVGAAWVSRCPLCNRGYRGEFILWVYNPDEQDPVYLDEADWKEQLEKDTIELEKRNAERNKDDK